MDSQLSNINIPYIYIDASFPSSFKPELASRLDPYAKLIKGKAELGCAMSHINACKYIVENFINTAIILEDDAELAPDFEAVIKNLKNVCFDVCLLGTSKLTHNEFCNYQYYFPIFNSTKIGKWRFGKSLSRRFGTVAYVITLKGAQKIISSNDPPKVVADNWEYFESFSNMNIIEIRPLIVFERWDLFGSQIDIDRGNKQLAILFERDNKTRGIIYWLFRTFKGHINLLYYLGTGTKTAP